MKKSFAVCLLILGFSVTGFAEDVAESPLGNVRAVKRIFTVDVNDCDRSYVQATYAPNRSMVYAPVNGVRRVGSCEVNTFPEVEGESLVSGYHGTFFDGPDVPDESQCKANYRSTVRGYKISLTKGFRYRRSNRECIANTLDRLPAGHRIEAVVYTVVAP